MLRTPVLERIARHRRDMHDGQPVRTRELLARDLPGVASLAAARQWPNPIGFRLRRFAVAPASRASLISFERGASSMRPRVFPIIAIPPQRAFREAVISLAFEATFGNGLGLGDCSGNHLLGNIDDMSKKPFTPSEKSWL